MSSAHLVVGIHRGLERLSYNLSVHLGSTRIWEVEFAVNPEIWRTTTRAQEKLRLRDGGVVDAVVSHFVDATDNNNVLSRKIRDDVLEEFSCVPDLS